MKEGGFILVADVVPITDQLFTAVNIGSLGIATGAVTVVTNAFKHLLGLAPTWLKWIAFGMSMVIAMVVVAISSTIHWYDWIFGFINGCLLFCTALGANEIGRASVRVRGFFQKWL
jgi:hypothetical protein